MTEDTLLAEIKEEIGRDRLERFFTRFKKPLIGLIAFIIIGFGSYEFWKFQTEQTRQKAGTQLFEVLSDIDNGQNIERLNEVESGKAFTQLAKMTEAKILIKDGFIDQAIAIYEEIYSNKANDQAIRDLAKINETKIILNTDSSQTKIKENLQDLVRDGRPFKHSSLELLAVYELENGNAVEAEKIYQQLVNDGETPTSISLRAKDAIRKSTLAKNDEQPNEE